MALFHSTLTALYSTVGIHPFTQQFYIKRSDMHIILMLLTQPPGIEGAPEIQHVVFGMWRGRAGNQTTGPPNSGRPDLPTEHTAACPDDLPCVLYLYF